MRQWNWPVIVGIVAVFGVGGGILMAARSRPPAATTAAVVATEASRAASVPAGGPTVPDVAVRDGEMPRPAAPAPMTGGRRDADEPRRLPGREIETALSRVNLTEGQKRRVEEVKQQLGGEIQRIETGSASPDEKRQQARAARQRAYEQIRQLLTPEQKQQLEGALAHRGAGGAGLRPALRAEQIREALARIELSPEQREKMDGALRELQDVREKARSGGVNTEEGEARQREAFQKFEKTAREVLTPEQQRQLEADLLRGGGERRPGGRRGGGQFGGMVQRALTELEMTSDQKRRLEEVLAKYRGEAQRMGTEMQQGGDPEQMRERMQSLRQRLEADVMAILTPQQQEKYRQIVEQMRSRGREFRSPPPGP
jgi:Spy/CpxP family protein refolding chaperone